VHARINYTAKHINLELYQQWGVNSVNFEEIAHAIVEKKARWTAQDHPFLKLPEKEILRRTGVAVDKADLAKLRALPKPDVAAIIVDTLPPHRRGDHYKAIVKSLTLRRELSDLIRGLQLEYPVIPPHSLWCLFTSRDWRNVAGGRNCVTSVKDQGGCGSCVAFGISAALESMVLIEHNIETDLSEAELFFCNGRTCAGGWWPTAAIDYVKSKGVAHETCFPYHDHDVLCRKCSLRDGEAISVENSVAIFDVEQRKDYLFSIGPMIAVFEVYPDFGAYSSGVYSPTVAPYPTHPTHCIEVIGFNECTNAWICKNSWGSGWGDGGFFSIAYGACGIDTTFPFWGINKTKWWK
jgi:hypothetical protein